ncbi:MAG: DUF5615 family PIN-like protein [Syntrophobacteraceae bacterium]
MKFKIDENLPVEIADLLNGAGYDALTVSDQNLSGTADPEIISKCNSEERALISLDLGFANIHIYPPENLPGLIVLRLKSLKRILKTPTSSWPWTMSRMAIAPRKSPFEA